ncbi:MAG: hypothetical protein ABI634_10530 [Acidobacteriota bacterium]
MRYLLNQVLSIVIALATPAAAAVRQNPAPVPVPEVEVSQHAPADFAGAWEYNAAESLNAATGKPEQAPRSATQRGRGTASARGGGAAGGRAGGDGGFGGVPGRSSDIGPTPEMLRASRDLMRDLLEIPESLDVTVTPASITFKDDLDRSRSYPTDGSKHSYRLGGSSYDARVVWKNSQLRKDIDGDYGFKMSEVYFLSNDAKRLFVILRVADMRRNAPMVGADRVYDRVDRVEAVAQTPASR